MLVAAGKKEEDLGNANALGECAKTAGALLSFPPFACVQKLKTTSFVCEQNKAGERGADKSAAEEKVCKKFWLLVLNGALRVT